MEEDGGLGQTWRLNLNFNPQKAYHKRRFDDPPSYLQEWQRPVGLTGPGILPLAPIPSGEGRLAILSPFIGAGLEGQTAEGMPGQPQAKHRQGRELQGCHTGFPRWLWARARCSLHSALMAISMQQSDRLWRVSSEPCSLQSPGLCMSCHFCLSCSFSRPCQPHSHLTCKTMCLPSISYIPPPAQPYGSYHFLGAYCVPVM